MDGVRTGQKWPVLTFFIIKHQGKFTTMFQQNILTHKPGWCNGRDVHITIASCQTLNGVFVHTIKNSLRYAAGYPKGPGIIYGNVDQLRRIFVY